MNKSLLKAIEKVLDDPVLAKKFFELENLEEMYAFLQKYESDFTIDELKYAVEEIVETMFSSIKLEDENLLAVAGGNNMTDIMKKITGTSMAVLSLMGPMANITSHAASHDVTEPAVTSKMKSENTGIVKKFENALIKWTKENPGKTVGGVLAVTALSAYAIKEIKRIKTEKGTNAEKIINVLDMWWKSAKKEVKANEFRDFAHDITEALVMLNTNEENDELKDYLGELYENKGKGLNAILNNDEIYSNEAVWEQNKEQAFTLLIKIVETFESKHLDKKAISKFVNKFKIERIRYIINETEKTITVIGKIEGADAKKIVETVNDQEGYTITFEDDAEVDNNLFLSNKFNKAVTINIEKGANLKANAFNEAEFTQAIINIKKGANIKDDAFANVKFKKSTVNIKESTIGFYGTIFTENTVINIEKNVTIDETTFWLAKFKQAIVNIKEGANIKEDAFRGAKFTQARVNIEKGANIDLKSFNSAEFKQSEVNIKEGARIEKGAFKEAEFDEASIIEGVKIPKSVFAEAKFENEDETLKITK